MIWFAHLGYAEVPCWHLAVRPMLGHCTASEWMLAGHAHQGGGMVGRHADVLVVQGSDQW